MKNSQIPQNADNKKVLSECSADELRCYAEVLSFYSQEDKQLRRNSIKDKFLKVMFMPTFAFIVVYIFFTNQDRFALNVSMLVFTTSIVTFGLLYWKKWYRVSGREKNYINTLDNIKKELNLRK